MTLFILCYVFYFYTLIIIYHMIFSMFYALIKYKYYYIYIIFLFYVIMSCSLQEPLSRLLDSSWQTN